MSFNVTIFPFNSSGISLGNEVDDGTGTIWLDDMHCSGNEQKLSDCPHRDWGEHNCGHSEDVGIECINGTIIGIYINIKLCPCRPIYKFLSVLFVITHCHLINRLIHDLR